MKSIQFFFWNDQCWIYGGNLIYIYDKIVETKGNIFCNTWNPIMIISVKIIIIIIIIDGVSTKRMHLKFDKVVPPTTL